MSKSVKRGYVADDKRQFGERSTEILRKAAEEVRYLLDRGYPVKPSTVFVGNHYQLSERQRLSLARGVSSKKDILERERKRVRTEEGEQVKEVSIDGFNTIITLEVMLSGSPVFLCNDGTVRDLAGLRGTYSVIDKTETAVKLLLAKLDEMNVEKTRICLDKPVSNSGRLKTLICETAENFKTKIEVEIIDDVDRILYGCENVISSDAIILNECKSWINLIPMLMKEIPGKWLIDVYSETDGYL